MNFFQKAILVLLAIAIAIAYLSPQTYTHIGEWASTEATKLKTKLILNTIDDLFSDFFSVVVLENDIIVENVNSTEILNVSNNEFLKIQDDE